MHDGLELGLVVERQTADTQLGQQVVFAHFTPTVVVVIIESAVEAGIVHIGRQLVLIAFLGKAP